MMRLDDTTRLDDASSLRDAARRYRPGKMVGRGGCGRVFAATDTVSGLPCAIKEIHIGDRDSAKRALREVRFMRSFRHNHVISVQDLFQVNTDLFVVMPRMDTDLAKVIQSPQALSGHHVQYFTVQLLDGLAFLHDHCNVLHRDLKPANLLVNESCYLLRQAGFKPTQPQPLQPRVSLHSVYSLDLMDSTATHGRKIGDFGLARDMCGVRTYVAYTSLPLSPLRLHFASTLQGKLLADTL